MHHTTNATEPIWSSYNKIMNVMSTFCDQHRFICKPYTLNCYTINLPGAVQLVKIMMTEAELLQLIYRIVWLVAVGYTVILLICQVLYNWLKLWWQKQNFSNWSTGLRDLLQWVVGLQQQQHRLLEQKAQLTAVYSVSQHQSRLCDSRRHTRR